METILDVSRRNEATTIVANDSLNIAEPRRRTNRVHNQRKNTGKIIWNDVRC